VTRQWIENSERDERGNRESNVYFWHQPPAPPDIPQSSMGYHCDEYRLRGAGDVHEVLDWATSTARAEQTFTLYVEHLHDGRPGLIHLAGDDPTVRQ